MNRIALTVVAAVLGIIVGALGRNFADPPVIHVDMECLCRCGTPFAVPIPPPAHQGTGPEVDM